MGVLCAFDFQEVAVRCQEVVDLLHVKCDFANQERSSDNSGHDTNVSGFEDATSQSTKSASQVSSKRKSRTLLRRSKRRRCQTVEALNNDSDESNITSAIEAFEKELDEEVADTDAERQQDLDFEEAVGQQSHKSQPRSYCSELEACEQAKDFFRKNITIANRPSNRCMMYRCEACGKMLGRHHEKVFFHVLDHLNISLYRCHVCEEFSQTRAKFEQHINRHGMTRDRAKQEKFQLLDSRIYGAYGESTKRRDLGADQAREGVDVLFECIEACFAQFQDKEGIVTTRENAKKLCAPYIILFSKNPTRYKCLKCDYECDASTTLMKHVMIHLNLFLYQCPECGVKINQEGNFERHLNNQHQLTMHSKYAAEFSLVFDKNYVLTGELANKSTKSQERVTDDAKLNDRYLQQVGSAGAGGVKPCAKYYKRCVDLSYECNTCGALCNTGKLIKKHILDAHGQKFPFGCDLCDETFSSEGYLKIHSAHHKHQNVEVISTELGLPAETLDEDFNNLGMFCTPEEAVSLVEPFITVEQIEPLMFGCKECEYLSESRHNVRQHLYQHFNIFMYRQGKTFVYVIQFFKMYYFV